jgi:hypothetical protein
MRITSALVLLAILAVVPYRPTQAKDASDDLACANGRADAAEICAILTAAQAAGLVHSRRNGVDKSKEKAQHLCRMVLANAELFCATGQVL